MAVSGNGSDQGWAGPVEVVKQVAVAWGLSEQTGELKPQLDTIAGGSSSTSTARPTSRLAPNKRARARAGAYSVKKTPRAVVGWGLPHRSKARPLPRLTDGLFDKLEGALSSAAVLKDNPACTFTEPGARVAIVQKRFKNTA